MPATGNHLGLCDVPGCSAMVAPPGHLVIPTSCLAMLTTGTWAVPERDEEEKEEGCWQGVGWSLSCRGDT